MRARLALWCGLLLLMTGSVLVVWRSLACEARKSVAVFQNPAFSAEDQADVTGCLRNIEMGGRLGLGLLKAGLLILIGYLVTIKSRIGKFLRTWHLLWSRPITLFALAGGVYALAWLSTPRIQFGKGRQGMGYGDDGSAYGAIAEDFRGACVGRAFSYRVLPSLIVRGLGLGTFRGFEILNLVSYLMSFFGMYYLLRTQGMNQVLSVWGALALVLQKFSVKFWIYYPILTDALGMALLVAGLWAVVAERIVLYMLFVTLGLLCRENVLVLVLFHSVFVMLRRQNVRNLAAAILVDLLLLSVFLLYRRYPLIQGQGTYSIVDEILFWTERFILFPRRTVAVLLSLINSLGVLVVLPFFFYRHSLAFLRQHAHWSTFLIANLGLVALGGMDSDRFALYLAPGLAFLCVQGILCMKTPLEALTHLLLVQLVWSELFLPWAPDRVFYLSRFASHAKGWGLALHTVLAAVLVAVVRFVWRSYLCSQQVGCEHMPEGTLPECEERPQSLS